MPAVCHQRGHPLPPRPAPYTRATTIIIIDRHWRRAACCCYCHNRSNHCNQKRMSAILCAIRTQAFLRHGTIVALWCLWALPWVVEQCSDCIHCSRIQRGSPWKVTLSAQERGPPPLHAHECPQRPHGRLRIEALAPLSRPWVDMGALPGPQLRISASGAVPFAQHYF